MVGQHHERRQVVVQAAESVADPRSHPGESRQLEPSRLQIRRLAVDTGFAHQVVDECHLVGDPAEVGHRFTQQLPALAMRFEVPDRLHPGAEPILERLDVFPEVTLLTVAPHQFGFVVEQVDVAGGTRHEQLDDPLGFGTESRESRRRGVDRVGLSRQKALSAE